MTKTKQPTHSTNADTREPQASITRTDKVITGQWGNQSVKFDLGQIADGKLTKKDTFIGAIFDEVIDKIPAKTTLDIPAELPAKLPTSKKGFWQLINSHTTSAVMHDTDIAASDIIIRPALEDFSVFDLNERSAMIQAGRQATLPVIADIKKLQQK